MEICNESRYLKSISPRYLLIGNGRVARHLAHYLTLENLSFETCARSQDPMDKTDSKLAFRVESLAQNCTHVLLLISDSAIESFYLEHPILKSKITLHFSGSLASSILPGAHPLMTFSQALYDLETYRRIPFVVDQGFHFEHLLPGLTNTHFQLEPSRKALYHSLCVMSGNYTTLLWEKTFREFSSQLGLPKAVLLPYLHQVMRNLTVSAPDETVLTGPLARGDQSVLDRHLQALKNDPFSQVYSAFVNAYRESHNQGPST